METSFMCDQDVSFPVDMVEMGVRPMDWIDQSKNLNFDDSNNRLLCNEKPKVELTVFPAEFQLFHGNTKITKNEQNPPMPDDDDDDGSDYDIDPETGTKTFSLRRWESRDLRCYVSSGQNKSDHLDY